MGVKVVVGAGETPAGAMRRLKTLIIKADRVPVFRPKPTKKSRLFHQTRGQLEHQRTGLALTRKRRNANRFINAWAEVHGKHMVLFCRRPGE